MAGTGRPVSSVPLRVQWGRAVNSSGEINMTWVQAAPSARGGSRCGARPAAADLDPSERGVLRASRVAGTVS